MKDLNYRIAHWRKLSGYNQTEVAEKLGIKCNTYSQMERTGNVSAERFFKLAKLFNKKPCELFYGDALCQKEEEPVIKVPTDELIQKTGDGSKLRQSEPDIPKEPPFAFSNREESLIKMFRVLKKEDKTAVVNMVLELYQNKGK